MRITAFVLFVVLLFSCRKEGFTTDGANRLRASADTLHFDTVFTTTGSVTQSFKIINDGNKGIRIASIQLLGGASSPFRINADGVPGPQVTGVDVRAGDSVYVFVTVSVNPNAAALPFVVRDSLHITYNGNTEKVQLQAYGQNARFLRGRVISGQQTWNSDLPYVILGGLLIDEGAQLTIEKGTRVYLHADAPFIVDGTLKVRGERWDSTRVIFAGDRLDVPYRNFPAGWPGIIFRAKSRDNHLEFATIKNAYQGLVVQDPAPGGGSKLTLLETIIDNAYDAGILAINSGITARNVLVSNCGKNVILAKGGEYRFTHCTLASVSNSYIQHKDPVLYLSNYLGSGAALTGGNLDALFRNCIIWGEAGGLVDEEVVTDRKGTAAFSARFEHVLWRVNGTPGGATATGVQISEPPLFDSVNTARNVYSFRLGAGSPALNKGVQAGVALDLDGKPRPVGLPDLGAYERQ